MVVIHGPEIGFKRSYFLKLNIFYHCWTPEHRARRFHWADITDQRWAHLSAIQLSASKLNFHFKDKVNNKREDLKT